jgi:hypothetical protein
VFPWGHLGRSGERSRHANDPAKADPVRQAQGWHQCLRGSVHSVAGARPRNEVTSTSHLHRLKLPAAPDSSSGSFNHASHRRLQKRGGALWHEVQSTSTRPCWPTHPEDLVVSRTGFVQPFDRVCIELKACGANDFVELRQ